MTGKTELHSVPVVSLDTEKAQFQLVYDLLSSYYIIGTYTVEDGLLQKTTYDGKYTFSFQIVKDTAIWYVSGDDQPVMMLDGGIAFADGAEFMFEPES